MSTIQPLESCDLEIVRANPADTIVVRPIVKDTELSLVHRLTHDCYVAQGYASPQPDRRLAHYVDFDRLPETTVIVAMVQDEVVGSVSLTMDGPWGLTVDKDFKKACDSLRYEGRSLAVVWRLVMKESMRCSSRRTLMALFKEVTILATLKGANTGLLTVNPKHVSTYQRFLKMKEIAVQHGTKGLNNAPGILLRADYEYLPASWKTIADPNKFRLVA